LKRRHSLTRLQDEPGFLHDPDDGIGIDALLADGPGPPSPGRKSTMPTSPWGFSERATFLSSVTIAPDEPPDWLS